MIQLPAPSRARTGQLDRFGPSAGIVVVLLGLSLGAAALITTAPEIGFFVAVIVTAFFVTEYALPASWGTMAPLLLIFLTPADGILALSEQRRGLFVIASGAILATATVIRGRLKFRRREQWYIPALAAMYLLVLAIHVSKGELRNTLFWLGAVGLWIWIDGRIESDPATARRDIANAIIAIGAINGAVGCSEFLGVTEPSQWIPGYQPSRDLFTEEIGTRAVGIAWHPLPFGALCAAASALGITRLVMGLRERRTPYWLIASVVASGAGLIVSGARGSWLALVCGVVVAVSTSIKARHAYGRVALRGLLAATIVIALLVISRFSFLVHERLVGTAAAPQSIGQRVLAFQAIVDSLPDLPFLGVGPGGAAAFMLRGGALIPNIENEYLIALVFGGPLAGLGLLVMCALALRAAYRDSIVTQDPSALALCVTLYLNIATFNLFSWSAGPLLFATVTALAVLTGGTPLANKNR